MALSEPPRPRPLVVASGFMADRRLGLRVKEALWGDLHRAAEERGVPLDWLCERLLAEGLERLKPVGEFRLTRAPDRADKEPASED